MKKHFPIYCLLMLIALALLIGCTVRGGWPRFLRAGESPGWNGPQPDNVVTNK